MFVKKEKILGLRHSEELMNKPPSPLGVQQSREVWQDLSTKKLFLTLWCPTQSVLKRAFLLKLFVEK